MASTSGRTSTRSPLSSERAQATFNPRQLFLVLAGSKHAAALHERARDIVARAAEAHPDVLKPHGDGAAKANLTHEERYARAMAAAKVLLDVEEQEGLDADGEDNAVLRELIANEVGEALPLDLHRYVFGAAVESQCDEKQAALWVPHVRSSAVLGAYAQTELGHGSNVRGIETTATFVRGDSTFDLHTPTLTATKWWPGALGKTATHAVVFARLIDGEGVDRGVHPFIIQLRDMQTHVPLRGVHVGDIGAKAGMNGVDNGFLRMNCVRVPRDALLARFASVDVDGKYHKHIGADARGAYLTMVDVRVRFVEGSWLTLAKGLTIAIRYSAVRRQGFIDDKSIEENAILDYRMQQYRLLPLLAAAWAMRFVAADLRKRHAECVNALKNSADAALLPELHAVSSGLKSLCTRVTGEGLETCRKCCGGHGYMHASGLPDLHAWFTHMETAEGDNHLLTQQTARYLLKQLRAFDKQPVTSGGGKCAARHESELRDPAIYVAAHRHHAASTVARFTAVIGSSRQAGRSAADSWNDALVEIFHASNAYCTMLLVESFVGSVDDAVKVVDDGAQASAIKAVLSKLCHLFALHAIEEQMGDYLEEGFFTPQQARGVRRQVRALLMEIRPEAVALVDGFGISDYALNSALGRSDGRVYEALYQSALAEPLNAKDVVPSYDTHIKPILTRGAAKLATFGHARL
eukprot:jgi/Chlat1/6079/Chrsp4S06218